MISQDLTERWGSKLDLLSKTDLSQSKIYRTRDFPVENFSTLRNYARTLDDPDAVRTALYCSFQPLYDALLTETFSNNTRETAVSTLETLTDTGMKFLAAYYTGNPNIWVFREWLDNSADALQRLEDIRYVKKDRWLDDPNMLKPVYISMFLKTLLQYALEEKIPTPDFVVGCACGSSEIAMSLAGILECDVGFIRFSQTRGDRKVIVLRDDEQRIRDSTKGKRIICVEDLVETGETLHRVMKQIEEYGVFWVKGASVVYYNEEKEMMGEHSEPGFHLFHLPKDH